MTNIQDFANKMIATKRGIGMSSPFYAETASTKDNLDWPFWIVRNRFCNSLGLLMPRIVAEELAAAMNKATNAELAGD